MANSNNVLGGWDARYGPSFHFGGDRYWWGLRSVTPFKHLHHICFVRKVSLQIAGSTRVVLGYCCCMHNHLSVVKHLCVVGDRIWHIRKRDLSRQVRLGKSRSEQLESIELCYIMYTGWNVRYYARAKRNRTEV